MKKKTRKIVAVFMATLMVVGVLPSNFTIATVNAATKHSFVASAQSSIGNDKAAIPEGTTLGNGFFKIMGSVTQRTNNDGSIKAYELGKALSGSIQFTTTEKSKVVLGMSSTGGTNESPVGLYNVTNSTIVSEDTKITTVSGTAATALTYTELPAGTYQIVSPANESMNRGARVLTIDVDEEDAQPVVTTYAFDATKQTSVGADKAAIAEGTLFADGYLKLTGDVIQRTNSDGTVKAFELGKALSGSMQFTVTGTAAVTLVMSSTGGSNESPVGLYNVDNKSIVAEGTGIVKVSGTSGTTLNYTNLSAGTYQIVSPADESLNRGARIFSAKIVETTGGQRPARKAWAEVASPVIGEVTADQGKMIVPFTMNINYDGADKVAVGMKNSNGDVVDTQYVASEGTSGSVIFTPNASGNYTFTIVAIRDGETDKQGENVAFDGFVLPLATPTFKSATSQGDGKVSLVWNAVNEATAYEVSYSADGVVYSQPVKVSGTSYVVSGLTIGQNYTFKVAAVRGVETSVAATVEAIATKDSQRVWEYAAFGQGISGSSNGYSGSLLTKNLDLYSSSGKLVPANTDGLAFYYTAMDPKTENFTLTANVKVNSWTLSNGQEGFGLLATDAVGVDGDSSTFWNNSYIAGISKVEYYYDDATQSVSDTGNKITMKLGAYAQEKKGATAEAQGSTSVPATFTSTAKTLETSCATLGAGTYNLIGNYKNSTAPTGTVENAVTEFKFTLTRDNTGYRCSYTDANGKVIKQTFYDYDGTNLTQIDKDNIYVGFFASRNADITVSDYTLTTINPADDTPAEKPETTYVTPTYTVTSASATGNSNYALTMVTNADGIVTVKDPSGNVIVDSQSIMANTSFTAPAVTLSDGNNEFEITFDPADDYIPGEYQKLLSYDPITFMQNVTYKTYGEAGQSIWVSQNGTSSACGSKDDPMDIYTAVKYVQAGQTIVLAGGTYNLDKTIKIERGIDGTADSLITMVADPDATEKPVFDFGGNCAGMVLGGNYWYFQGFDVANSQDAQKGIQVSGKNCTLDQVNAYHNGNTGIQISRLNGSDLWANWPSDNLILNCTSYGNADKGYEDADGFAAKLTIADGNIFRGCISYNNADDGWDLFAKPESGPIGKVVIENCVAYGNGYLEDGTNAGNGNGFKLGGSSITGYHELVNCISYNNKAKGIDSNSCPDIQVTNCTSFNNGGSNVAFYTNDAANTDFQGTGILSFRTKATNVVETIKLKGTQDESKVYKDNNYYWSDVSGVMTSVNKSGVQATADWFVSFDTAVAPTRNADGSINMHGLLELTAAAPANVGARIAATTSKVITVPPSVPYVEPSNNSAVSGDISNDTPKTGDGNTVIFFILLSMISCTGIAGIYYFDKKKVVKIG